MYICPHSEGVHTCLLKCCRSTCSSVAILKGCMVRESLGTPALIVHHGYFSILSSSLVVLCFSCVWNITGLRGCKQD